MLGRAHSEVAVRVVGASVITLIESKDRNTRPLQLCVEAECIKKR